jgi:hypothetical protein
LRTTLRRFKARRGNFCCGDTRTRSIFFEDDRWEARKTEHARAPSPLSSSTSCASLKRHQTETSAKLGGSETDETLVCCPRQRCGRPTSVIGHLPGGSLTCRGMRPTPGRGNSSQTARRCIGRRKLRHESRRGCEKNGSLVNQLTGIGTELAILFITRSTWVILRTWRLTAPEFHFQA